MLDYDDDEFYYDEEEGISDLNNEINKNDKKDKEDGYEQLDQRPIQITNNYNFTLFSVKKKTKADPTINKASEGKKERRQGHRPQDIPEGCCIIL